MANFNTKADLLTAIDEQLMKISDLGIAEAQETNRWKVAHDINGSVGTLRTLVLLLERKVPND